MSDKVKIKGTSHVKIEDTPHVRIKGTSHMKIEDTPNVRIKGTSHVKIENTPHVKIEDTPHVRIKGTQHVKIDDTPHVRIKGTPHVKIEDTPHVRIKGTPHVKVSGVVSVAIDNRNSFTAQVISAPTTGAQLPNISIPNGFALSARAHVDNKGQVFVANSLINAITPGVPGSRITLNAGDVIKLFLTNANIVFIAGSDLGQNVDILVEQ